ncbi:MAG: hypothetical protein AB1894_07995 [Chloroflexota bacterium]
MAELVACRSNAEYAEHPIALSWEGQRLEIETILARWRTPEGKFFRVSTQDGRSFELLYQQTADAWQITQV